MTYDEIMELNDGLMCIGKDPLEFRGAVVGVTADGDHLVYSSQKIVEILVEREGWSVEQCEEYLGDNILSALGYLEPRHRPIVIDERED